MDKSSRNTFLIMTIPAFILFFCFHTLPALQGIFYSFTNWKGYGAMKIVGLKNYFHLFKDTRVLDAYLFTFKFSFICTILVNVLSICLALGLNANIRFKNFLRGVYFIPNVLSILIVGYIFKFIIAKMVPEMGKTLGIAFLSKNILGNPDLAWLGVILLAVWQSCAFNTIIYLSGLQTIPEDLYEASSIDGASGWQKFKTITFPLIAPFFTINMVLAMKNFLMVFDHIIALTKGGPGRATESIALLIYNGGFQGGELAYQSANAVIYFLVILAVSFSQIRILQTREVQM